MSNDPYAHGFEHWEKRYQEAPPEAWLIRPEAALEVEIAAHYYREKYGATEAQVLDLGAGDGRHTLYLAQQGFRVLAVDAARSGLERIQKRAEAMQFSDRVQVEAADLRDYVLPLNIDFLLVSYVVHLLPEPYRFIQQWQAHTRPGGICVIATRKPFKDDPEHYWFPEDFELQRLFDAAGWHVIHAREQEDWRPDMGIYFRQRAVVALKPE